MSYAIAEFFICKMVGLVKFLTSVRIKGIVDLLTLNLSNWPALTGCY